MQDEIFLEKTDDESIITTIETFKISRNLLLKNLMSVKKSEIEKLRQFYRKEILNGLQIEIKNVKIKLFPTLNFLKKFLLYDGIAK